MGPYIPPKNPPPEEPEPTRNRNRQRRTAIWYEPIEPNEPTGHLGTVNGSGQILCSCGWVSVHRSPHAEALAEWQTHRMMSAR